MIRRRRIGHLIYHSYALNPQYPMPRIKWYYGQNYKDMTMVEHHVS